MWSDNETDRDFLNFRYVADIAAEMIAQANGRPLSLGISGSWGVGKSSMMKLLAQSLRGRADDKFLFIEFNAWLYQGYDDTRAALMEIITTAILERAQAEKNPAEGLVEKAAKLAGRVNWFRLASVTATTAASLAFGLPPVGLIGEGIKAFQGLTDGKVDQADVDATKKLAGDAAKGAEGLIKDKPTASPPTPPRAIHEFRDDLKDTLEKLGVTLVVLIDDLDRCLPATTISTLEAMRLFLFMEHTAFIIAADEKMIREAVRTHFKDVQLDDELVTNYFDKLIQVPIRVPALGTQDVRAYLMMLFVENSTLEPAKKDEVRKAICKRLGETWAGKRIDRAFVASQIGTQIPSALAAQLDLADRVAPILTTSTKIAGNPRLIKRFLNTLSMRLLIANSQEVTLDEAALAKMLLFERCGLEKAYGELLSAINESDDGKARLLIPWEAAAAKGQAPALEGDWNTDFVREWLTLQPPLADMDLRGVVYVSREHTPIITAADRLSSEGASLLEGLFALTQTSGPLASKLKELPPHELGLIAERLLGRAKSAAQWGTPPILSALLTLAQAPGEHAQLIARFLSTIPGAKITAAIIPMLADKPWAKPVLSTWASEPAVKEPVKKAIANASKKG